MVSQVTSYILKTNAFQGTLCFIYQSIFWELRRLQKFRLNVRNVLPASMYMISDPFFKTTTYQDIGSRYIVSKILEMVCKMCSVCQFAISGIVSFCLRIM